MTYNLATLKEDILLHIEDMRLIDPSIDDTLFILDNCLKNKNGKMLNKVLYIFESTHEQLEHIKHNKIVANF